MKNELNTSSSKILTRMKLFNVLTVKEGGFIGLEVIDEESSIPYHSTSIVFNN